MQESTEQSVHFLPQILLSPTLAVNLLLNLKRHWTWHSEVPNSFQCVIYLQHRFRSNELWCMCDMRLRKLGEYTLYKYYIHKPDCGKESSSLCENLCQVPLWSFWKLCILTKMGVFFINVNGHEISISFYSTFQLPYSYCFESFIYLSLVDSVL